MSRRPEGSVTWMALTTRLKAVPNFLPTEPNDGSVAKQSIDAAARRQEWIDQSQSVNLPGRSRHEDPQPHVSARLAGRPENNLYPRTLQASNIEKATLSVKKEVGGIAGGREFSTEEKAACSIEAMRNGGTCEACQ